MFERQMIKDQIGKRGLLIYGQSIFMFFILCSSILLINFSTNSYEKNMIEDFATQKNNGTLPNMVDVLKQDKTGIEKNTDDIWTNLNKVKYIVIDLGSNFDRLAAIFGFANDSTYGYMLHFLTVVMVEDAEGFGILLFFRYVFLTSSNKRLERGNLVIPEV
jgi:hypothetical protein